ncbi:uncharacterized protein LOC120088404 isoform X2 [Benincasa hispida]|uniref:uncharacterized protein LOC120088404 isoform X2 n=1 Tax=Benincasa hispida TaxID=102211 RepID=UPI0018FF1569|nr:uncharacterized protein LOC120088404 isoform X2 [Benincasa hispida]
MTGPTSEIPLSSLTKRSHHRVLQPKNSEIYRWWCQSSTERKIAVDSTKSCNIDQVIVDEVHDYPKSSTRLSGPINPTTLSLSSHPKLLNLLPLSQSPVAYSVAVQSIVAVFDLFAAATMSRSTTCHPSSRRSTIRLRLTF